MKRLPLLSRRTALLCLIFLSAFWLRYPGISAGLPYLYDEDEAHHFNRIVEMVQQGDYNPHYFLKPSLHFYVRMPVVALSFLSEVRKGNIRSIKEIMTKDRFGLAGYSFSASHPALVKWNRAFTLLLSLGAIFLTFLIAIRLDLSSTSALLAALLVAVSPSLIDYSTVIGVDTVATIMTLASVTASLYALDNPKYFRLFFAALLAGLAVSTKYNVAPIVFVPLTICYFNKQYRFRNVSLCILGSILGFLIATPYSLIELPLFLDHLAYEIWHYGVAGHEGHSAPPGLQQASFYLQWFVTSDLGWVAFFFSLVGVLTIAKERPRRAIITLTFPILYFLLMASQKANFTRNMTPCIPFAALYAALGICVVAEWLRRFGIALPIGTATLFGIVVLQPAIQSISLRGDKAGTSESRLQAEKWLRERAGTETEIALNGELQLHRGVVNLPGITVYDPKTTYPAKLAVDGYDYIVTGIGQRFGTEKIETRFEGIKSEQRIVSNPFIEVISFARSDIENLFVRQLSREPEYYVDVKQRDDGSLGFDSPEGHVWTTKRFMIIPIKNVDALFGRISTRTMTFQYMSPWVGEQLAINGRSMLTIKQDEVGKWMRGSVELSRDDVTQRGGIIVTSLLIRSPKERGIADDQRRLGIALKDFHLQEIISFTPETSSKASPKASTSTPKRKL